jgi:hypothetical protein
MAKRRLGRRSQEGHLVKENKQLDFSFAQVFEELVGLVGLEYNFSFKKTRKIKIEQYR